MASFSAKSWLTFCRNASWRGWECGRSCQGCSGMLGWMGKVSGGSKTPGSHCCQASQWEGRPTPGSTEACHCNVTLHAGILCSTHYVEDCVRSFLSAHQLLLRLLQPVPEIAANALEHPSAAHVRTGMQQHCHSTQRMQPSRLGVELDVVLPCTGAACLYATTSTHQKRDLLSRPPPMYDCSHRRSQLFSTHLRLFSGEGVVKYDGGWVREAAKGGSCREAGIEVRSPVPLGRLKVSLVFACQGTCTSQDISTLECRDNFKQI